MTFGKPEKTLRAWIWRLAFGPSLIVEGAIQTISFGFVRPGLPLQAAKMLARSRFNVEHQ